MFPTSRYVGLSSVISLFLKTFKEPNYFSRGIIPKSSMSKCQYIIQPNCSIFGVYIFGYLKPFTIVVLLLISADKWGRILINYLINTGEIVLQTIWGVSDAFCWQCIWVLCLENVGELGEDNREWNSWFATFERVYPVNLRLKRIKSFFVYFGLWSWISKVQKCTYCRLSNLKGLNTATETWPSFSFWAVLQLLLWVRDQELSNEFKK